MRRHKHTAGCKPRRFPICIIGVTLVLVYT